MSDPALLAEAYKRGLLPEDKKAAYEEAVRRGVLSAPPEIKARAAAEQRESNTPAQIRAFNKGSTFGFADELDSLGAAGETGLHNAFNKIVGKPDVGYGMQDAYNATMAANKSQDNVFAAQHPGQNLGLQLAGVVVAPGMKAAAGAIKGATTLGQAALRSAAVGGAVDAISGVGNGEGVTGRAVGGVTGGATGAIVGGALPFAARGAQVVANRVGPAVNGAVERTAQAVGVVPKTPTQLQRTKAVQAGADYVAKLAEDAPPEALSANPYEAMGRSVTAAEALGRPAISKLKAVGRLPGQTPNSLESTLRQRTQAMPERVLTDMQDATGLSPEAVGGDFASHAKSLREAATPLYDEAYTVGGVNSDKLQQLVNRPSMRKAMSRAQTIAAEEGRDPTELGFKTVKGITTRQVPVMERAPTGEMRTTTKVENLPGDLTDQVVHVENPTAQTWDYVKRGLDDVLETYRDKTTGRLRLDEAGKATLGTLNQLRDELTTLNPKYKVALAAGGEPIRLEEAFRSAPKLMSSATPRRLFDAKYDAMTPADQKAFLGGFVNDAFEKAQNGKLKLSDMQSPNFQGKLGKMIGPDNAGKLLTKLQAEMELATTGKGMMPPVGTAQDDAKTALEPGMRAATRTALRGNIIGAVGQALVSPIAGAYRGVQVPINQATRDEVGRLLQMAPSELATYLKGRPLPKGLTFNRVGRAVPIVTNVFASQEGQR